MPCGKTFLLIKVCYSRSKDWLKGSMWQSTFWRFFLHQFSVSFFESKWQIFQKIITLTYFFWLHVRSSNDFSSNDVFVKQWFAKHHFAKQRFVKWRFVKQCFVKQRFVKRRFVKQCFIKIWKAAFCQTTFGQNTSLSNDVLSNNIHQIFVTFITLVLTARCRH
jgi:hypothetical protein